MEYTSLEDGFYPRLMELGASSPHCDAPVERALAALRRPRLDPHDFAALLSPAAADVLEQTARRAHEETLRHFGRAVQLFAPLYLANICTNRCVYCGFHAGQKIRRAALSETQIQEEARALAAMGLRRVLVLTGDAPKVTGASYIARAVAIVAGHIPSVGIEVQALTRDEYALVCEAGADSMTMFQETYDPALYASVHPAGPKRNFAFRLDAPHRAALAGMRGLTLGALLGLGDWRREVFFLGMHAAWLARRFPHVDVAFSLPRIRARSEEEKAAETGDGTPPGFVPNPVSDREFVQALVALRCFLPHAGITMSSRESASMRDRLLPLGVTRVSAGVRTSVGGYAAALKEERHTSPESSVSGPVQFVIDDPRTVPEMERALERQGYQPVHADWILPRDGTLPLAPGMERALGMAGSRAPAGG